jgi:hypothetical protein
LPVTPPPPARTDWALTANGASYTASSPYSAAYPAQAAGDGDRKGANWGNGGGWNDATPDTWPDSLETTFGAPHQIAQIDVYTVQDNYSNPVEPTDQQTFTQYGITDFEVQYWDGTTWVTVPGGSVTGNNRVVRRFPFTPVTTSKVRVLVLGSLGGYSRITEIEAWDAATASVDVAAAANGATAVASSSYVPAYAVAGLIDGERSGTHWGAGGGWNDATLGSWPDWAQVNFASTRSVTEIDVYTVQDNYNAPQTPTESMTFSQYGITDFDVQYWTGSAWATVPGGSITGNNLVWRKITFPALSTSAIRVVVNGSLGGYSRITEIEAWAAP